MAFRNNEGRYWEIDFIRGIALLFMIGFHLLYDLKLFGVINWNLYSGILFFIAYGTASTFILVAGISASLRYHHLRQISVPISFVHSFIKRGIKILFLGFIITLVTLLFIPEQYVIFGILHCMGISTILCIPFLGYKKINVLLGSFLILIGIILRMYTFDFSFLIPFGFIPHMFSTVDYFPLLPWFGVFLIGITMGHIWYPQGMRKHLIHDYSGLLVIKRICAFGTNSLYVYFLHQPLLFAVIFLFLYFFPAS